MNMNRKTRLNILSQFSEQCFVLLVAEFEQLARISDSSPTLIVLMASNSNERISFPILGLIPSPQLIEQCRGSVVFSLPSYLRLLLFQVCFESSSRFNSQIDDQTNEVLELQLEESVLPVRVSAIESRMPISSLHHRDNEDVSDDRFQFALGPW
jgi:hypothetical protein